MKNQIRKDAEYIIAKTIEDNLPDQSVKNALEQYQFDENTYVVAIGKAAWTMAKAASEYLGDLIKEGVVITKYEHSLGEIAKMEIVEAGHPIADENSILGSEKAVALANKLTEKDTLLFLVSGGGSALFEQPLEGISLNDLMDINEQLLACGADIVEINMIRKRLSNVKAGKFANHAHPAEVKAIILSDVLGDRLDSIASGPAAPDLTTTEEALNVVKKYDLKVNALVHKYLNNESPKEVPNVTHTITGSVKILCESAAKYAEELGYSPHILATTINCEAKEAGKMMSAFAQNVDKTTYGFTRPCAIIMGGETVVRLTGKGKGGRNQEIALASALGIAGIEDVVIFSLGSDGTDGPTDAAGGIVDGSSCQKLKELGYNIEEVLSDNNSYPVLKEIDGLIMTGPTGTNVNDVTVLLMK